MSPCSYTSVHTQTNSHCNFATRVCSAPTMSAPPLGAGASSSPHAFALQHQRPRNSFVGCSRIGDYEVLGKLGEGTFGEVHRAKAKKTGAVVALKKIIMHNEKDGVSRRHSGGAPCCRTRHQSEREGILDGDSDATRRPLTEPPL